MDGYGWIPGGRVLGGGFVLLLVVALVVAFVGFWLLLVGGGCLLVGGVLGGCVTRGRGVALGRAVARPPPFYRIS